MATIEPQPFSSTFNISPAVVMPFPRETERIIKRVNDKRRGKTAILTSSPYKAELVTIERERSGKKNKGKRALFKKNNNPTPAKDKKANKKKMEEPVTSSDEEQESDDACSFCNDLYSNSKDREGWIRCNRCRGWAHEACSNAEEGEVNFICDYCN
ncbi:hypothetical protein AVEN_144731-1 [Araneus ventricosus]|uniref:Zinc finger PHD-type domain-containing protein n=1 Tax=Araneus ventricosus TaxID=182803 RepID=A0A4Y2TPL8_ARAVE|nr:hypothetical protein AVEN_251687-1 [Araneus ventricosus]GBO01357.1 hypothetical protein AVEN_144731-1 [Araneus ventricosus]